ncbi:MAG: hypothetical protein ONB51_08715 [candidate division KSB1 bacterium]|nr:hypothetical protein [candidate division KSB1 bacterium]
MPGGAGGEPGVGSKNKKSSHEKTFHESAFSREEKHAAFGKQANFIRRIEIGTAEREASAGHAGSKNSSQQV